MRRLSFFEANVTVVRIPLLPCFLSVRSEEDSKGRRWSAGLGGEDEEALANYSVTIT